MKKGIVFFVLFIATIGNAQDISKWQVGINLNPFFFTRISPDFSPEKQNNHYPNGFGAGITLEKNWNEHWGVKTGFEWSEQTEKYAVIENSADNTKISLKFIYYKVPLCIQYSYPLKEKLFLTFNQGIQFLYLDYFKEISSGNYQIFTGTPDYYEYVFFEHPENNRYVTVDNRGKGFSQTLFGVIGSVGIKGFLSKKISYSTNIRYEFDLTDADKSPSYKTSDWAPTHNLRIGLELGLQYHFSLSHCGFCEN